MENKIIKPLKPIKVVSVTETLAALVVGQSTDIPFKDAASSTVASTASRIEGKTFKVITKGRKHTSVTRIS